MKVVQAGKPQTSVLIATSMNVTCLTTCDSSTATGKKEGKASATRCKGGRTAKLLPEITTFVLRQSTDRSTSIFCLPPCNLQFYGLLLKVEKNLSKQNFTVQDVFR